MKQFARLARLGVVAMFAAAVTGCIVLPFGGRHGHGHGHGYQGSAPAGDSHGNHKRDRRGR